MRAEPSTSNLKDSKELHRLWVVYYETYLRDKCQLRRSSGVVVAGPKHFVCHMDCLRVHVTVAVDRMLPHL